MKYEHIELPSLVLYGNYEEEFITLLPRYLNAHNAWIATSKGMTVEEFQKLTRSYAEYDAINKQYEELPDTEENKEQRAELEAKSMKLALNMAQNAITTAEQVGLSDEQLELVDKKRKEFTDIRRKMIIIIANGLRKENLKDPIVSEDELLSLRTPTQEVLIYDVGSDPENNLPGDFLKRLGALTPTLPSMYLSQDTLRSSQTSIDGDKKDV